MEQDPVQVALSTDIVMDIVLSHLNVRDLLRCRLVSEFWNKAASSILRKRSTMIQNITGETHLMDLKKCMRKNSDFPFTGLALDKPWKLKSDRAIKFFKNYGDRLTRLRLNTCLNMKMHYLVPFIDHLPRLSILEVGKTYTCAGAAVDSDARQEPGKILNLPSVRTIRIFSAHVELKEEVLCEVLLAASPSLQIECLDSTPKILRILERAGKLGAVTFMKFNEDHENANYDLDMEELLSTESPSLTKLEFNARGSLSFAGLTDIFFSSQDTLKELHMDAILGQISWEEFPVFSKLTKLTLCFENHSHPGSLFNGKHGYKFPALKCLKLRKYSRNRNARTAVSDSLFIVPSVTKIELEGYVDGDDMKKLARSFPNVIEMRLHYGYYSGDFMPCGRDPFEIWNVRKFKRLEKLQIWNYIVKRPGKDYIGMDRFLTGIPNEMCENLRKQNRLNLIDSPFNEVLRYNPNILQLKNLKELVVCMKPGSGFNKLPEDSPFMSMVSVWYALEMIPNLQAKFVYKRPSPLLRNANRDKAVLKAAFKHVYPSVKLESFA